MHKTRKSVTSLIVLKLTAPLVLCPCFDQGPILVVDDEGGVELVDASSDGERDDSVKQLVLLLSANQLLHRDHQPRCIASPWLLLLASVLSFRGKLVCRPYRAHSHPKGNLCPPLWPSLVSAEKQCQTASGSPSHRQSLHIGLKQRHVLRKLPNVVTMQRTVRWRMLNLWARSLYFRPSERWVMKRKNLSVGCRDCDWWKKGFRCITMQNYNSNYQPYRLQINMIIRNYSIASARDICESSVSKKWVSVKGFGLSSRTTTQNTHQKASRNGSIRKAGLFGSGQCWVQIWIPSKSYGENWKQQLVECIPKILQNWSSLQQF